MIYETGISESEMQEGKARVVQIEKWFVALIKLDGKLYAFNDQCPHRGAPLSEGTFKETTVTCPWHGARFDLLSGSVLGGSATMHLKVFPASVQAGTIFVDLP